MASKLVYVCCLTDARDESYIEFAMMLMSLSSVLPGAPRIHIHFARTVEEGLAGFRTMCTTFGPEEIFVAIPTTMASNDFMTRCVAAEDKHAIIGVHPIPVIDWEAVEKGEPPYRCNVDAPAEEEWVQIPNDAIAKMPPIVFKVDGTVVAACTDPAGSIWSQWAGEVWADNKAQLSIMGKNTFAGCVGYRQKVR